MINKLIKQIKAWIYPAQKPIELDWSKHPNKITHKLDQVVLDKPIERWRIACSFNGVSNWH